MRTVRIALAQINSTVGDLSGNLSKISDCLDQAKKNRADIIAFPELALTGYPPEDLLLKSHFIEDNLKALEKVLPICSGITAVIGFVDRTEALHNAAAIIDEKKIRLVYHKCHLPNYGVFDEARYFQAGRSAPVFTLNGVTIGVNICEDIWSPEGPTPAQTREGGAQLIINISASPYRTGISKIREEMLATRAKDNLTMIAYVNMVGGQDELVFDGASLIFNEKGELLARAKPFKEDLLIADLPLENLFRARLHAPGYSKKNPNLSLPLTQRVLLWDRQQEKSRKRLLPVLSKKLSQEEEIYRALITGLSDYVRKNGFKKVVVALSGGVDSALTAVVAVDALGPDHVVGVFMPSRYTSKVSHEDVESIVKNIGISLITIPIAPTLRAYFSSLSAPFRGFLEDTTEENLQSRIRGNMMMALSNKFGWLVLTTGNKSEMSVGYATLYGDMAGGFGLIKDLWKTVVYRLLFWRNSRGEKPIPARVLTRPPTAELRPNQADQDTLPPYALLDPILEAYIEEDQSFDEIVAAGFDPATVARVIALVDRSEFKRRQAPVGIKITPRALGKDRRMPITNLYRTLYSVKEENRFTQGISKKKRI